MNDVFVTCIKNGRFDQFGRPLVSGSSYTLSWSLARDLWLSGYVSVTDTAVFDSSSVDVRRPNLYAELAARAGAPRRRTMYTRNLLTSTVAKTQTAGTVTESGTFPNSFSVTSAATATGGTTRAIGHLTMTVSTEKYYEWSATVSSVSLADYPAMSRFWMATAVAVAAGSTGLRINTTRPVAGQRYAFRFKPAGTSIEIRIGLGCDGGESVTIGDSITFTDMQLCEVDGLSGSVMPFSYGTWWGVGAAAQLGDTIDSCVLCLGDSWSNGEQDFPGVLASKYNREVVISATGGYTLALISSALTAFIANGTTSLFRPNFHIPGVCVIQGGINDIAQNRTAEDMFADLLAILAILRPRNIVPIVMLPTLATDSSYYTAARANEASKYSEKVYAEVQEVMRSADYCLNADGTAHTTNMMSETGAWIHPSAAGHILIAKALDDILRRVGSANHYRALVSTW